MDNFDGGDPGMGQGCHPLKRLRRQGLDEMEDQMMAQGRPAAQVVNMRAHKNVNQEPEAAAQE